MKLCHLAPSPREYVGSPGTPRCDPCRVPAAGNLRQVFLRLGPDTGPPSGGQQTCKGLRQAQLRKAAAVPAQVP